jgi:heavy metal translocating P-type ATPase
MMRTIFRPEFRLPLAVLALLILGFIPPLHAVWVAAIAVGVIKIGRDSIEKIREGTYSLDYIALLAMLVSLPSGEYLAGAVVALMITGGEALDEYASRRAEGALRALAERIPKHCMVRLPDGSTHEKPIQDVRAGEVIVLRSGELIPLDGTLVSPDALLNEANLTGEPIPQSLSRGSFVKSGSVNAGEAIDITVEATFEHSTYMRIVNLVSEAKRHQSRTVRLAEQVNFPFTAAALALAAFAFFSTHELSRALAVLVIATPCPLLIAAPVAFIGGLSRAARKNVIVKRPSTLEAITQSKLICFDKTGTLTLGEPALVGIEQTGDMSEEKLLALAAAIEFHSIHPLARALSKAAQERKAARLSSSAVEEKIGTGISGVVEGKRYLVAKASEAGNAAIALAISHDEHELGRFLFEDVMKPSVAETFSKLKQDGFELQILTGDREENAKRLFGTYGVPIRAELSPEKKYAIVEEAQRAGVRVVMIGDGLNDAPALSKADVGVVFSGTENSAAIEAADVAIMGHDLALVEHLIDTAQRSMRIARQSIYGGVALSIAGMLLASAGLIPPVLGAVIQELIDIAVILNSVRTIAD